jgi:hypothetical protein
MGEAPAQFPTHNAANVGFSRGPKPICAAKKFQIGDLSKDRDIALGNPIAFSCSDEVRDITSSSGASNEQANLAVYEERVGRYGH